MGLQKIFQIKWYHVLIGLLGLLAVILVLAWILLARDGVSYIVEDQTDIVS